MIITGNVFGILHTWDRWNISSDVLWS